MTSAQKFLLTVPIVKLLEENKLVELIKSLNVRTFFKNESI